MKRKRFLKIMMALGLSRNQANQAAQHLRADGCCYQEGLENVLSRLKDLHDLTQEAGA